MLVSPHSQYFSILGFNIYFYGIILALSIFIGVVFADKIAKKYYNISYIFDISFYVILFGIIFARIYYCLLNPNIYFQSPLLMFNIREGGLSIHGAIIGGLFAIWLLSKTYKFSILKICDIYAIILPLAQSLGRWGNFINSEAFGKPTNSFLKLYIAPYFRPAVYENYEFFHPTFLYESILDLILFFLLYKLLKNNYSQNSGFISGIYLIGYACIRLLIEPLRIDCTAFIGSIQVPIIISLIMIVIGSFLIKKSLSSK